MSRSEDLRRFGWILAAIVLASTLLTKPARSSPLSDLFPDLGSTTTTVIFAAPSTRGSGFWDICIVSDVVVGQAVWGIIGASVGSFGGCSSDPSDTIRSCEGAPDVGATVSAPDSFLTGPDDFGVGRVDTLYVSLLSESTAGFNDAGGDPAFLGILEFTGPLATANFTLEGVSDLFGLPALAEFDTDDSLDDEVEFRVVPEPTTGLLLAAGLALLGAVRSQGIRLT